MFTGNYYGPPQQSYPAFAASQPQPNGGPPVPNANKVQLNDYNRYSKLMIKLFVPAGQRHGQVALLLSFNYSSQVAFCLYFTFVNKVWSFVNIVLTLCQFLEGILRFSVFFR